MRNLNSLKCEIANRPPQYNKNNAFSGNNNYTCGSIMGCVGLRKLRII